MKILKNKSDQNYVDDLRRLNNKSTAKKVLAIFGFIINVSFASFCAYLAIGDIRYLQHENCTLNPFTVLFTICGVASLVIVTTTHSIKSIKVAFYGSRKDSMLIKYYDELKALLTMQSSGRK